MQNEETLFARLGGTQGISRLVDDIVAAHMENPTIKARFTPYTDQPERMELIKQHTVQFFSAGSGGPADYQGKSMPDAHRGMNISEEEYLAAVDDIMAVLEAHAVDEQSKKDVLAIAYSLKGQIMRC